MRGAVVEFRELEKVAPDFQVCQKCLADALYASGEQKEALEHYRKAAQLDPTDFEVSLALGRILEDQKRNDEALSEYQRSEFMKKTGIDVPKSIQLASLLLGSEPGRARRLFSRCGAF